MPYAYQGACYETPAKALTAFQASFPFIDDAGLVAHVSSSINASGNITYMVNRRPLRQLQRSYNPDFFCWYKSHSQQDEGDAAAIESNPDDRGNLLKGALFKFIIPVGLVIGVFAVWTVYKFFQPKEPAKPVESPPQAVTSAPSVSHAKPSVDESENWRVVGWIVGTETKVIIERDGKTRSINPPAYKLTGLTLETFLPNGEAVAPWTGGAKRNGLMPAQP